MLLTRFVTKFENPRNSTQIDDRISKRTVSFFFSENDTYIAKTVKMVLCDSRDF